MATYSDAEREAQVEAFEAGLMSDAERAAFFDGIIDHLVESGAITLIEGTRDYGTWRLNLRHLDSKEGD
jgi:hypothetical protein